MELIIKPAKYVIAISGGVDSMVLLDLASKLPDLELIVAHFEHGIREDSDEDRQLVEKTAARYGLTYVYERGYLGPAVSEAKARDARYKFLRKVKHEHNALAIITAHHQDDLVETAVLNLIRGTGRKGLSSLKSEDELLRPLLNVRKQNILNYAHSKQIQWHEDSTNLDDKYMRNYIRHRILPKLDNAGRQRLLMYITKAQATNPEIDNILRDILDQETSGSNLNREWFIMQQHSVARELIVAWLHANNIHEFDKKTIERLVVAAKVLQPSKVADINGNYVMRVKQAELSLICRSPS